MHELISNPNFCRVDKPINHSSFKARRSTTTQKLEKLLVAKLEDKSTIQENLLLSAVLLVVPILKTWVFSFGGRIMILPVLRTFDIGTNSLAISML